MCIEALKFYIGSKFTAVFVNICHILLDCFEFTCTISASSPKSNSAYLAIDEALALVERTGNLPVPLHLRNSPTKLMKDLNYGKNYKYSHDFPNHFVEQQFLPQTALKRLSGKCKTILYKVNLTIDCVYKAKKESDLLGHSPLLTKKN